MSGEECGWKELGMGRCMVGAQMWGILDAVRTEEMALSSFGETRQTCSEIWICEAVFPRESVPSARPRRTVTGLLGEAGWGYGEVVA